MRKILVAAFMLFGVIAAPAPAAEATWCPPGEVAVKVKVHGKWKWKCVTTTTSSSTSTSTSTTTTEPEDTVPPTTESPTTSTTAVQPTTSTAAPTTDTPTTTDPPQPTTTTEGPIDDDPIVSVVDPPTPTTTPDACIVDGEVHGGYELGHSDQPGARNGSLARSFMDCHLPLRRLPVTGDNTDDAAAWALVVLAGGSMLALAASRRRA